MKLTAWHANLIWYALLLLLVGGCNSGQVMLPTATGVAGPTSTSLPTSQSPTSDGGSNPEVAIEALREAGVNIVGSAGIRARLGER